MVITVVMAHPVINPDKLVKSRCSDRYTPFLHLKAGLWLALACLPVVVQAAEWDSSARLTLSEVYSDNIRLSVTDEESESITTVKPGFSLKGQGARLKLGIDYSMQNLFYAQNPDQNRTYNQLKAYEQSELIKDFFYFDSSASISQRLSNPTNNFAQDNLNLTNNRGDVTTLRVEPYLKRNLGGYVSAELRHSLSWIQFDNTGASDAKSSITSAYLTNGLAATKLSWRLDYRQQSDIRDTGVDSERRSSKAMISYRVISTLSLVGYAGRQDNNIQTSRSSVNGSYWSAGFNWMPGPKFSLEATTGENYDQVRLSWNPITRTSVNVAYSERGVGLNTSATWSGKISHRTRRSTWAFDYSESVTSTLQLELAPQPALISDGQGGILVGPDGVPVVVFVNVYELTDEEFLRARAKSSVSYKTGKSKVSLVTYKELRTYELSGDELASEGGSLSWRWQFASRTSATISFQEQRFDVSGSSNRRMSTTSRVNLARSLGSHMNARVELRRNEVDTDAGSGGEYIENRISAYLNMSF